MTTKTIVFSALGLSAVGGIAAGGALFMSPSTIGELLQSEGTKLLDPKGDKEKWETLASKHTGSEVPTKDGEKISPIDGLNNIVANKDNEGIEALKKKCKDLLSKTIGKGDEYEKDKKTSKNWCTHDSPLLKADTKAKA